jgi:hypothetical protein
MNSQPSIRIKRYRPLLLILGGLLIIAVALFVLFNRPPASSGNPSLAVDQKEINFGDVKFGQVVKASFELTNMGAAPLKFTSEPYIEVREGC